MDEKTRALPDGLRRCSDFHGHLCPGLVYGYLAAGEAIRLLALGRSEDEEVVAFPENDFCAVDALQVLLGTIPCAEKKNAPLVPPIAEK